ncbi:MAG: CapA family protein [Patescibacteria group bacterium]
MKKLTILLACCLALVLYIYVEAPTKITPKNETKTISLNFVGDILAARTIETAMRKNGYDYPFAKISKELADADITFANLETPLIAGNTTPGGNTVFRADTAFADALKRTGIDIVSLANNHMKDQGEKGIVSTKEALDKAGVVYAGAGLSLDEARSLRIVEANGIKVGYLAYNDTDVVPQSTYANDSPQSGTNTMDTRRLKEDIEKARSQVNVVIISMHSGTEYVTEKPNTRQTTFARAAIDYGADMVIGHHPHVLQPMEIYKNKYIFYSLGNFVFDQIIAPTKESALLKMWITFSKTDSGVWKIDNAKPEILPLVIQNFQPQKTTDISKKKLIMSRFNSSPAILTLGEEIIFAELATTTEARTLGLSGRKKLPDRTGLLFVFEAQGMHGIWMKDMLFPIDIYWFDQSFKLIDKRLSVSPETYPDVFYPKLKATYVLETKAGLLDPMSLTQDLTGELTLLESYDKR